MVSVISSNQTYSRSGMAIAGRGARACDMCGKERARWYCAADEAYLCERCDASVHSANSVARKHDRVKLGPNGAPMKLKPSHNHHHHHHHHHSSAHANKIRKTACGNKPGSTHNIRMDCDHEIHDESLPLLLLEGGVANVLSQQVPKVEQEEQEEQEQEQEEQEEQAKEEQVVLDQGDIMSSMGSRRWWRSSRKRARTPRGKCCTPVTPSNLTTHPHPNNIEHDHDQYITCGNPISTMVKEEKDIIDQDQDSILLFDSLLSCDDDCMDKFGHDYPPLCYKEDPFILVSHGAYNTCFTTSDQSMSHHEVPTYEPLLQELIDDVNHHGDLMEKILSPSCPTSPSFCITTNASCCHINDNPDNHAPPSLEFSPTHDTCDNNSGEGLSGISSSNLETNSFRGCDFIDDGSLSINEDSEIDTFDMMDLCSINASLDDDHLNGSDIQEDFPGVEMWREAYGEDQLACHGNVIFEGNPFNGKGERALVEIGSCVKVEEFMDGEVELPQPLPSRKLLSLRLDYEEVLNAWSDRGSLWMDGQRPQIVPDICLFGYANVEQYGGAIVMVDKSNCDNNGGASQVGQVPMLVTDSGREARVSRYREKRRTRLFSKKIRYEVRKLNAERRPRMKGRFVKRTTIAAM